MCNAIGNEPIEMTKAGRPLVETTGSINYIWRASTRATATLLFLAICTFFFSHSLSAQPENKIRDAIFNLSETHPLRVSIFRIQPRLIVGSAYDSNAYSTEDFEASDYFGSIAPGASVALKLGHRAYFVFQENINILFYQEQDQLSDVFDTTSGMFGIGSRRLLFNIAASYYNKKARIDEEFDQPAQQRLIDVNAQFSYALRKRTGIYVAFKQNESRYELDAEIPTELPITPDTRIYEYGGGFDEEIGNHIRLVFGASFGTIHFLNLTLPEAEAEPESTFWKSLIGLEFNGNQLTGRAKFGFNQTESIDINGDSFNDLIIDTEVNYKLGRRLYVGGLLKRARSISGLSETNFRLTTQGGVTGCAPLNQRRKLFVDGMWIVGQNNYGDQIVLDDQTITKDTFHRVESGLNFTLPKNLVFRFGTAYQNRDSNISTLTKDRITFNIGLVLEARRTRVNGEVESCRTEGVYFER